MSNNNLIDIKEQLNDLKKKYTSALIDYKDYYTLVQLEPENTEYSNFFSGIQAELQHYSQTLFNITQTIVTELSNMEKNVISKSNKLENQKKIYNKLKKIYDELQQKQNGSSLFINDSKELYNEQYYKNMHIFIGITGLISMIVYLARKRE